MAYTAIGLTSGVILAATGLVSWWCIPVVALGWMWLDLGSQDDEDEV